jgi:hypothetical protein
MTSTIESVDQIEALLSDWPKRLSDKRGDLINQIYILRDVINRRRMSIQTLDNFSGQYPNVHAAIRDRKVEETFSRLFRAFDGFLNELNVLPSKLPENSESTLRPYASEVNLAATALKKWAAETRSFSESQRRELISAK